MKSITKNYFACKQKVAIFLLCSLFFGSLGCNENSSDQITYPEAGKYGSNVLSGSFLKAQKTEVDNINILDDGFFEAQKTEFGRFEYSVNAEIPSKSSLKIVIRSTKQPVYHCFCKANFSEWHETCPECGRVNTIVDLGNEWGGFIQGSENNWKVSNVRSYFTFTSIDGGKRADASVIFTDDCIIEFYENGSTEPTKVKTIKVISDQESN